MAIEEKSGVNYGPDCESTSDRTKPASALMRQSRPVPLISGGAKTVVSRLMDCVPDIFALAYHFKEYFEIVPALTDTLRDEVYRVRHQVYCEELAFESIRPDRRERDDYDDNALHLLIRSVKNDEFIACTRMVLCAPGNHAFLLPFEKACGATLDRTIVDPAKLSRDKIGEVSRLAVISRFRRRKGEGRSEMGDSENTFLTTRHSRFPYIPLGLYLGLFELARLNGLDTLFTLTEPRLVDHFHKLGFRFRTIGEPVDHHGQRIPAMIDISSFYNNLRHFFRPLYRTIAADIARGW